VWPVARIGPVRPGNPAGFADELSTPGLDFVFFVLFVVQLVVS
jgi:hypothetical protein